MEKNNISKNNKGGVCMDKSKGVTQVALQVPMGSQIATLINRLTLKWNAKSLLDQEASETLQTFISTVMSALNTYETENKDLKEKLIKYEKQEKKA